MIRKLYIILLTTILCLQTTAVYADGLSKGSTVELFINTYLWDGADIDAGKIAMLTEPAQAEITGDCTGDRYPVKVGLIEAYIDKVILERAANGQIAYSGEDEDQLRDDIVNYAMKFLGNPYVWGGTSLTNGADCSGFVQAVFADHGIYLPRTSQEMGVYGTRIDVSEAKKGDLILYAVGNADAYHVAISTGDGKTVQAANSRLGIIKESDNGAAWAIDCISELF